jgi:hypothetical protein
LASPPFASASRPTLTLFSTKSFSAAKPIRPPSGPNTFSRQRASLRGGRPAQSDLVLAGDAVPQRLGDRFAGLTAAAAQAVTSNPRLRSGKNCYPTLPRQRRAGVPQEIIL